MRQAGVIAAGALYALEHHRRRLSEDHETAQILAEAVRQTEQIELTPDRVDTNIVIFRVDSQLCISRRFGGNAQRRGSAGAGR